MLKTPTIADCVALVERLDGFNTFAKGWTVGSLVYCIDKAICDNLFINSVDVDGKLDGFVIASKDDDGVHHIVMIVATTKKILRKFARYAIEERGLTNVTGYRRFKHGDSVKNAPRIFKLAKV
jgi:hypothetical protein